MKKCLNILKTTENGKTVCSRIKSKDKIIDVNSLDEKYCMIKVTSIIGNEIKFLRTIKYRLPRSGLHITQRTISCPKSPEAEF